MRTSPYLTVCSLLVLLILSACTSAEDGRGCTRNQDCRSDEQCEDGRCVDPDEPQDDGDAPADGDISTDGDGNHCPPGSHWDEERRLCVPGGRPDGDPADGDAPDGDSLDCPPGFHWSEAEQRCKPDLALDGDVLDGDIPDGDVPDGDVTDGDTPDGDSPPGDGDEESCIPNHSFDCDSGDVYWFDSCGTRQEKKEECDDCNCDHRACVNQLEYEAQCHGNDLYWYDCHGTRRDLKEVCASEQCEATQCLGDYCAPCQGDPDCRYGWACLLWTSYPDKTWCAPPCETDDDCRADHFCGLEVGNCAPRQEPRCYEGDQWKYDACDNRLEVLTDCGNNGCSDHYCHLSCSGGVCTDPATGFEWQQDTTGGKMNFNEAITHCQNLTLDGGGWRLPNISELRTLIRNCADIDTSGACGVKDECSACGVSSGDVCLSFSSCYSDLCNPSSCSDDGGPTGCYLPDGLEGSCWWNWSSSLEEDNYNNAWYISFDQGFIVFGHFVSYSLDIRCLR